MPLAEHEEALTLEKRNLQVNMPIKLYHLVFTELLTNHLISSKGTQNVDIEIALPPW